VQQTREDSEALELTQGQIVYARPNRAMAVRDGQPEKLTPA
jgi:hypothetical protein